MREIIAIGSGINRKTGKNINFKIPASMSQKGLECIRKNVEVLELRHPETKKSFILEYDDIAKSSKPVVLNKEGGYPYTPRK